MTVNTRTVSGRRTVRYESPDELLADAEVLVAGNTQTVGNWSLGQILRHLASNITCSIDGYPSQLPWVVRFPLRLLFKRRFLNRTLPAGFQFPKKFSSALEPGEVEAADALQELREALRRLQSEERRRPHPVLGKLTREEWDRLHCRHAELHMSFAVPQSERPAINGPVPGGT